MIQIMNALDLLLNDQVQNSNKYYTKSAQRLSGLSIFVQSKEVMPMTRLKIGVSIVVMLLTLTIPDSSNSYSKVSVYAAPTQPIEVVTVVENISKQDLHCLVLNTYHEARGESEAGQIAVMQVVLNRVQSDKFPTTICDVVTQGPTRVNHKGNVIPLYDKCQFKWFCDGRKDDIFDNEKYYKIQRLALEVVQNNTIDITNRSLYYHSTRSSPYWKKIFHKTVQIDNHIFYREKT